MTPEQQEALFRATFEDAAVGLAWLAPGTGRYLRANRSHCELLGYRPDDLQALAIARVVHPDDRAQTLPMLARIAAGESDSFKTEWRFVAKDRRVRWCSVTLSALRTEGASEPVVLAVVEDVTEHKQATAALRESEELLVELLEHSPIYVFFKDEQIRSIRLSRNYEQLLGRPLAEIVGKSMADLFPSDLAKSMVEDDRRILTEGHVVAVDEELDGRHYHTVKFPICRPGRPDCLGGFTIETTEYVQAVAALRESEEKYRTLYNEAPVMLHSIDANGRLVSVSNRWLEALGYERHEVIGRKSTDFLTDLSRKYAEEFVLPRFFEKGAMEDAHYQFVRRNGEVLDIRLSAVVERNAAGEFVCSRASLIDVTEQNRMEAALRQSQKMESVGRLAGGIAHDFNNLLLAILGNVELALARLRPGDPLRHELTEVQNAGERAAALTHRLLAFSRKQILQPKTVDLNVVVSGIHNMLHRLIGEDVALVCDLSPVLGLTRADPGQVEQVIVNLVVNAREAMPAGGTLTLRTANATERRPAAASAGTSEARAFVTLSVTDTGVGMDDATKAHLYEPFFTTKEPGKGTGLGLATVYGIVTQSGGEIDVRSEPGKGTEVTIFLPLECDGVPESPVVPAPTALTRGTETILVVEDETPVRTLAKRILSMAGYAVLTAATPGEALLSCETHRGSIDLVLSDVVMPQMSGAVLIERLRVLRPGLRVLYMSGYTDDAVARHGVLESTADLLAKPFRAAELTRRVREVLDAPPRTKGR